MPVNIFPTVDIDLTLDSIEGIEWNPEDSDHQNIPNLRASVSFAGSPRNMRVSSFTMCGRTGNLVVESGILELKKAMSNGRYSLGVDFGNTNVDFSRNQSSLTTSSSTSTSLPHLRLDSSLKSLANASARTMSIEEANGKSYIFPDGRICVESNPGIEVDACGSADDSRLLMEESLEWERNNPGRPDVVDIFVSLHTEENEVCAEGIAHLVLFGMQSESAGAVTTLNLRLKENNILNSSIPEGSLVSANLGNSYFFFGPNASVRVQLTTITDHVESLSAGGSSSPQKGHVHIGNLKERMNQPDLMRITKGQAAKTPNPSMAHGGIPEESSSGFFCTGIDLEESLYNVFGFNEERPDVKNNIMSNMTFESTIVTRESLLI